MVILGEVCEAECKSTVVPSTVAPPIVALSGFSLSAWEGGHSALLCHLAADSQLIGD